MSMQTMQSILCRGVVDPAFRDTLLSAPHEALREYDLSADEFALLVETPARSLFDLAAAVEAWRRGERVSVARPELALAG